MRQPISVGVVAVSPASVLLTGATGSIGGALALEYASPGRTLFLQGRRADRLSELAEQCTALGAHVETVVLDVRERDALTAWLRSVCATGAPDLVIANAGMNTHVGADGEGESWGEVEALIEVNVLAMMSMVDAILPAMQHRRSGQVALVSSLAAYFGLPVTPAYCASKAAVKAYGEALRGWLAPRGIRVNVVMPGYVTSAMCDGMPGPKPFTWTAERAAKAIRRGLEADQARITFPFPLNWGTWWLAVLPASLSLRIVRWLGYGA